MGKRRSRKPNGKRRHRSGATPEQRAARARKRRREQAQRRAASAYARDRLQPWTPPPVRLEDLLEGLCEARSPSGPPL